jgi:glycosyltransferase involved in cell wall biosynthesis
MSSPKVSVIIPAYNGADYLGEAIQSVVDQTYSNFELIVVDDASPDRTAEVVKGFGDPRLKYLLHPENQGSDVARYTGLQASAGEIIAFLDQDDYYHPEKLQEHVSLYDERPDIGFTYNARFELNYSSNTIRDIWCPPREITLAHLVAWFPLSPTDVMLRRKWALQMDLRGGTRGAEILHFSQLHLAGCKFVRVDRALNYRRYHSDRKIKNLAAACASELKNQEKILSDPRCPSDVLALRNLAHANIYIYWSYLAFAQDETTLGQEFLRNAVRLKPSIVDGTPCELVNHFLINCIDDEKQNHETLLQRIFAQLPPEIAKIPSEQYDWAIGRGYLLKGTRALIWNRLADGDEYFGRAVDLGIQVDESYLSELTHHLLNYEMAFGDQAVQVVIHVLVPYLEALAGRATTRDLKGLVAMNRAFRSYDHGDYAEVPGMIFRAVATNPKYLANRGVLSILLRTATGTGAKPG